MAMKKAERKESYRKIVNLMAFEQHEEAFNALLSMYADDASVFVLASNNDVIAGARAQKLEQENGK
jgi:ketosteroid isomerase-like protein